MLIHRADRRNRASILKRGLIPNYGPNSGGPKGFVCVTTRIKHFRPQHFDYWEILGEIEIFPCEQFCPRKPHSPCQFKKVIKGIIPPERLRLLTNLE